MGPINLYDWGWLHIFRTYKLLPLFLGDTGDFGEIHLAAESCGIPKNNIWQSTSSVGITDHPLILLAKLARSGPSEASQVS
jgi:hypothetical protein